MSLNKPASKVLTNVKNGKIRVASVCANDGKNKSTYSKEIIDSVKARQRGGGFDIQKRLEKVGELYMRTPKGKKIQFLRLWYKIKEKISF